MSKPRFLFTYGSVSTFADRLRFGSHDDFSRFHLVMHAGAPANEDPTQAPVSVDLPKKDRAAYERAAAAFNAIMDEHEAAEAQKLARRRARHAPAGATSSPAVSSASALDL